MSRPARSILAIAASLAWAVIIVLAWPAPPAARPAAAAIRRPCTRPTPGHGRPQQQCPASVQVADLGLAASRANASAAATASGDISVRSALFAMTADLQQARADVIATGQCQPRCAPIWPPTGRRSAPPPARADTRPRVRQSQAAYRSRSRQSALVGQNRVGSGVTGEPEGRPQPGSPAACRRATGGARGCRHLAAAPGPPLRLPGASGHGRGTRCPDARSGSDSRGS